MPDPIAIGPQDRVLVLTGAGISAESGLQTFRDSNGLWENHRVEDVASPTGWQRNAELVWRFYSLRREQARTAEPNPAHRALAALEQQLGSRFFLVTQNVDDLHERGGSQRLLHMHGELRKSRCEMTGCTRSPFIDDGLYMQAAEIPRCHCGARIRPHIVWFGEIPLGLDEIESQVTTCHLFVVIGSSGSVYPAAGLVDVVERRRRRGEPVRSVYIGPAPPQNAGLFTTLRLGKAGDTLPELFRVQH